MSVSAFGHLATKGIDIGDFPTRLYISVMVKETSNTDVIGKEEMIRS